jgi:hypothetical protein
LRVIPKLQVPFGETQATDELSRAVSRKKSRLLNGCFATE